MPTVTRIVPCLWCDSEAEDAAKFYVGVFKNSKLGRIIRYGKAGFEQHGRRAGSVLMVEFELEGTAFTALNAGPSFKFTEAISFQLMCETQAEIDYYWEKLGAGGDPKAQVCGWLKDKFGLSWQFFPTIVPDMLKDENSEKSQRVFAEIMQMKKPDINRLRQAFEGQ